jgi:hypothetical protein
MKRAYWLIGVMAAYPVGVLAGMFPGVGGLVGSALALALFAMHVEMGS